MSENPDPEKKELAPRPVREIRVVRDDSSLSYMLDTARFEHVFRIAAAMAAASLIPEHLRGIKRGGEFREFEPETIKANCFLVVNQAFRWGMDPFAVAPETYVVGGKLAYQGKLVAAVINARAGLQGRLGYKFAGTKGTDDFEITVSGLFPGETQPSEITLRVGDAKTDNQMWRKDPEQKLVYSGAVKWARRYCPEVVLGVVTDDDIERINESAPKIVEVERPLFPAQETAVESVAGGPPRRKRKPELGTSVEEGNTDFVADTPQKLLLRKLADAGVSEADYVRFLKAAGVRVEMIAGLSDDDAEKCLAGFDNDIAVVKEGF